MPVNTVSSGNDFCKTKWILFWFFHLKSVILTKWVDFIISAPSGE